MTMKIAIVHNFYSTLTPSGENEMVLQQCSALSGAGYEVRLFSRDNDQFLDSRLGRIRAAWTTATGIGRYPLKEINSFKPSIVLTNNLFPNIGSTWISEVNAPVISIVHNYRNFCANGTFFRDGARCFDCTLKTPLEGIKNSCYKRSSLLTLPLTVSQFRRLHNQHEFEQYSYFIAISEGSKAILVESGLPSDKTFVVPNFIEDLSVYPNLEARVEKRRWIAAGRLTEEKGFVNLVNQWPDQYNLDIVGNGPLYNELNYLIEKRTNIKLLGQMKRDDFLSILPRYSGAIHPSLWPEFSLSLIHISEPTRPY